MEFSPYLAHISATGQTQTILEHLCGTASFAKDFARYFNGEEQAELAGMAHGIRKHVEAFQRYLQGESIQNTDPM